MPARRLSPAYTRSVTDRTRFDMTINTVGTDNGTDPSVATEDTNYLWTTR